MKHTSTSFLLVVLLSACASTNVPLGTTETVPAVSILTAVDFSKYSDQGFLMTSGDYTMEYESIGMLMVTAAPEARRTYEDIVAMGANERNMIKRWSDWQVDEMDVSDVLDMIYREATARGANAIISLTTDVSIDGETSRPVLTAKGIAIRRQL